MDINEWVAWLGPVDYVLLHLDKKAFALYYEGDIDTGIALQKEFNKGIFNNALVKSASGEIDLFDASHIPPEQFIKISICQDLGLEKVSFVEYLAFDENGRLKPSPSPADFVKVELINKAGKRQGFMLIASQTWSMIS